MSGLCSSAVCVQVAAPIPAEKLVYSYGFEMSRLKWTDWINTVDRLPVPISAEDPSLIVPTTDTARCRFLLNTLLGGPPTGPYHPLLLVGPTGTGKSVYIKTFLMQKGGREQFDMPIITTFSAQTTCRQTQDIISTRLHRRRKHVYGPPFGKLAMVFIDDLSLPVPEPNGSGAQPPIELLRQCVDQGGWYETDDQPASHLVTNLPSCIDGGDITARHGSLPSVAPPTEAPTTAREFQSGGLPTSGSTKGGSGFSFREIQDIRWVAAMGPPGGGRHHVTHRYLRHFCVVWGTSFDAESLSGIFTAIMDVWMKKG
ncbi:hypothetical protein CBR_g31001 [Chara braunii]|nr:hypothetical protein CBR_g31001 [Chara braunii]|eukprot:GBG80541.1 hypothetical protein CBR_g31001 [Chara braunii]